MRRARFRNAFACQVAGLAALLGVMPLKIVGAASPLPPLSELQQRQWLNEHVIASSTDGRALDPFDCLLGKTTPLQIRADDEAGRGAALLAKMGMTGMPGPGVPAPMVFRDYVVRRMLQKAEKSGKPIVVFAHGGLNFLRSAIKRAATEGPIAEKECYPIYVCWDSSFSTSYWDHLTKIRNGVNLGGDDRFWGNVTAPVYLFTDLATSIVRTPRMLVDLGRSNLKGATLPIPHNDRNFGDVQDALVRYYALTRAAGRPLTPAEEIEKEALRRKLGAFLQAGSPPKVDKSGDDLAAEWDFIRRQPDGSGTSGLGFREPPRSWAPMPVSKGRFDPEVSDSIKRIVTGWTMAAPKLLVLAILGGAGGDMWDVMSRRTQVMYHYEAGFRPNWGNDKPHASYRETNPDTWNSESTGIGCMAVFFRKLREAQQQGLCRRVKLVGHSMGAMIFDEGLREFPTLQCEEIVYLAAACSIRDFNNTVVPYLERPENRRTQFYAICLHPRAEDRDNSFMELVPRGSLLVWIDEFLGHPQSFTDRRMGHFENAMLASRLFPPRIQKRLHFTALATGPSAHEMDEHGQFSSAAFYRPEFYRAPADVPRAGNPALNLAHKENQAARAENARRYLPSR